MQFDIGLPFGDLAQEENTPDGPLSKGNEEACDTSAWNLTQWIPTETSTAVPKAQSPEQRNECLLPLGLGKVHYAPSLCKSRYETESLREPATYLGERPDQVGLRYVFVIARISTQDSWELKKN